MEEEEGEMVKWRDTMDTNGRERERLIGNWPNQVVREELPANLGPGQWLPTIKVQPRPKNSHLPLSLLQPTQSQLAAKLPTLMRAGVSPDWVNSQSVSLSLSSFCVHCISPFPLPLPPFYCHFCSFTHVSISLPLAWRSLVVYRRKFAFIFSVSFSPRCTTSLAINKIVKILLV